EHHAWRRDPEYYGLTAYDTTAITGGTWACWHGHQTGFLNRIGESHFGTFLTGCYADWLFKGHGINKKSLTLFGKQLPINSLGTFQLQHDASHYQLRAHWDGRVLSRLRGAFGDLATQ